MADPTWEAKIILEGCSTPVTVQVVAFDSHLAAKQIEAMYAGKMKSWCFHPYIIIDEYGRRKQ